MTLLFCLVDVVVIQAVGLSVLCNSSGVDASTPASSTDWSSRAKASYLLCRGTRGGVVGKEKVHLLPFEDLFPLTASL